MPAHTCARHRPGSPACYRACGCRCSDCRVAANRAKKLSRAGVTSLVDATPVRLHIETLIAAGHTANGIASAAGTNNQHVEYLRTTARRTRPQIAAAILAVRMPVGVVDAAGTRRRLQALAAIGWDCDTIAARLGLRQGTQISRMRGRSPRVNSATAARVRALYDELWDQPGPSRISRARAAAAGWLPPLSWDDGMGPHGIDNPDATPAVAPVRREGERGPVASWTFDDLDRLAADGHTIATAADRIGVHETTIWHRCKRMGRRDILERLIRNRAAA